MSIQVLPPTTIRTIGATQVLTDPASVVKELVDNALDARATAILIEISTNTIDLIQLRDNGHGIAPEDRVLVCRRYCTSKIRGLEDLRTIGGTSLGFRGEALASAAELCGNLTVTTRVEGEDVAVVLETDRGGELAGQDGASHPVGTTVRCTSLFDHVPVRKQTALKAATKTLAKIKRLLQCYALARPTVRFSLKVLKANNEKGNWTYAPAAGAPMEDTACKVVGKGCASQCQSIVLEVDRFEIKAFLPRVDADVGKVSGVGRFLSIDGRPVATSRGTLKNVLSKFREKFRASDDRFAHAKEVFAWIDIKCPAESYDANVEPAKDDLVFENPSLVVGAVRKLLDQMYPAQNRPAGRGLRQPQEDVVILEDDQETSGTTAVAVRDENVESTSRRPHSAALHEGEEEVASQDTEDVGTSNSWTMAMTRTPARPRRTGSIRNDQLLTPLHERTSDEENSASAIRSIQIPTLPPHPTWTMPSPRSSPMRLPHVAQNYGANVALSQVSAIDVSPEDSISVMGDENRDVQELHPNASAPRKRQWTGWQPVSKHATAARRTGPNLADDASGASQTSQHFGHASTQPRLRPSGQRFSKVARYAPLTQLDEVSDANTVGHSLNVANDPNNRPNMDIRAAFGLQNSNLAAPQRPRRPSARPTTAQSAFKPLTLPNAHPAQSSMHHIHQAVGPAIELDAVDMLEVTRSNHDQPSITDAHPLARKPTRTRSLTAHFPLERVPHGLEVQHLTLSLRTSAADIEDLVARSPHIPEASSPSMLDPLPDERELDHWQEVVMAFLAQRGRLEEGVEECVVEEVLGRGMEAAVRMMVEDVMYAGVE